MHKSASASSSANALQYTERANTRKHVDNKLLKWSEMIIICVESGDRQQQQKQQHTAMHCTALHILHHVYVYVA